MLVLSRKKNESIVINDDITIVIVEIRGDKVRLGVEAPAEVPVHRNETYEAICHRNPSYRAAPVEALPRRSFDPVTPIATVETAVHDGLCCPKCESDQVEIVRLKQAYQGKELVRWRKCLICAHQFQTLEKVADL
jgi:carbon storage regulator